MKITYTMKPILIIEDYDHSINFLQKCAIEGGRFDIRKIIYNNSTFKYEIQGDISKDTECFIFGSINCLKYCNRHYPYDSLADFPLYNFTSYFGELYPYLLNKDAIILPKKAAEYKITELGEMSDNWFVKSNSSDKKFAGGLYPVGSIYANVSQSTLKDDELLVLAKPKKILTEYRCVVSPYFEKMYDCGEYFPDIRPCGWYDRECLDVYFKSIVHKLKYHADPILVLDIAELDSDKNTGNTFEVIEINALSTSGLYSLDPHRVLDAVEDYYKWKEIVDA